MQRCEVALGQLEAVARKDVQPLLIELLQKLRIGRWEWDHSGRRHWYVFGLDEVINEIETGS